MQSLRNIDSNKHTVDYVALTEAAAELAALGTAATLLNTWGIEHTTTIRSALLLSGVNILTPFFSTVLGSSPEDRNVPFQVWLGCGIAFASTTYATVPTGSTPLTGFRDGDFAVLFAACFYSLLKVRLADKARRFPPQNLAAARNFGGAILALGIFLGGQLMGSGVDWRHEVTKFPIEAWALLFFSASVSGVAATILQATGQRDVPPAQAQTIFAGVPLVAAIYDVAILREPLEDREILAGAAVIAGAALSASAVEPGKRL